ncbi:MAG TPA: YccF domain-containing protein [Caldilineaceae bacterium]|nr:YccF domain-containing protein [Caldilineaceae bacterium]
MSCLGNLIWLIFGGFFAGLGYIIGGLLLCVTIIGIPFGLQSIKLGVATLAPFGKEIVESEDANSPLRIIFNILWLVLFGWEIALAHLGGAILLTLTVIGIPFALQHIKLIPLALFPFGRDLRAPES